LDGGTNGVEEGGFGTSPELIVRSRIPGCDNNNWSLVGKIQVVAVDRLWEHIPIVGLMVVENKRCGERWIDTYLLDKDLGMAMGRGIAGIVLTIPIPVS
ncbi:hypothetical protein Tco_0301938, partial [Tanacetum coccineum]